MMQYTRYIPNSLTIFRIAAIPIIVLLLWAGNQGNPIFTLSAGGLFLLAAFTDYLDGYSARRFNVVSTFGKSFDPIADKMLVLSVMMMLIYLDKAAVIPCIIILCREITITGMREYLSTSKQGTIPVSRIAKYKTTFQLIALSLLLLFNQELMVLLGNITLWIAALLALASAYLYLKGVFAPR